jgi:phage shock protein PspC (stress-responsive transcriptional regulator)
MKRTTTVNIAGMVFHIDEDAYEKLSRYLRTLKHKFGDGPESQETMNDFELRIAELLQGKMNAGKQVVTIEDIQSVIQTIGEPEEIDSTQSSSDNKKGSKTLLRNPDDVILGGVCSGLAAYLGVDVWIIRLLTVLFTVFWGFGLFLYIVLWIILPVAKSPEQRAKMKGEPFDREEFERNVRENLEDMKQRINEYSKGERGKEARNFFERFFSLIGVIIMAFFSFVGAILGFAFLMAGLAIVLAAVAILFFDLGDLGLMTDGMIYIPFLETVVAGSLFVKILFIAVLLAVIIPLFMLISTIVRALSGKKAYGKAVVSFGFSLWIIAAILILVFFVLKKPFPEHTGIQESKTELAHISKDTLVITGIKQQYGADFDLKIDTKYIGLASYDSASVMYINPRLSIEKSNTGRFEMQIIKSARHRTLRKAEKSVEEINYQYRVENDTLKLNTFFESQPSKFWQSKKLEIKLFVPEGKTVYVDETLQYNLIDSDNMPVEKRRQMINRFWTQDNKTLK